jgi:hypothetical protein
MAKIVEHVKAENTEGIASAVLQVQHRPMRDVSTLERKAKKKAKAQNAQNRAYNARDLATRLQDIKDIVAANKEDIDQEAGTFVNTATGKHELYTSWVLRCK